MSQQNSFVCKCCHNLLQYDFAPVQENDWKALQGLGLPTGTNSKDAENMLNQSFVFVNENLQTLQSTLNEPKEKKQNEHLNLSAAALDLSQHSNSSANVLKDSNNKDKSNNLDANKSNNNAASDKKKNEVNDNNNETDSNDTAVAAQFSNAWNMLEQIVSICQGHSNVEYPICDNCMTNIVNKLDFELEELNLEQRQYNTYITDHENTKQGSKVLSPRMRNINNYDIERNETKENLDAETKRLQKRLKQINKERELLDAELKDLELESLRMDDYEELFFCDANDFYYAIENLSHKHAAVRQKIREATTHLEIMKRTNVFDDAFHISHDGHFGTINGLRLGKLASVNVDWEEINAGFGQCILVLDVLARRCQVKNFKFDKYELHPMGSVSYIHEKRSDGRGYVTHHMFASAVLFGYKQCDKALECFLDCIKQFADWIQREDPNFRLEYEINGDQIGSKRSKKYVSIRFASHSEEEWTQALKYMVIDLKFLLAWVARYSP